jgi:VWFA-related protein
VFRGAANLVYVDVYPKRDGRFVSGLGPGDFQVFEDGVPQKVETFELIRFPERVPGEFVRDPSSQAEGDQLAADPRHRVFVIYLDIYHVDIRASYLTGPPLIDFMSQFIGPADLFTVLTPLQYVSRFVFQRRIETLEAELRDNVYWGQARTGLLVHTPNEEMLQTCLPRMKDIDPRDAEAMRREAQRRQDYGNMLVRLYREDLLMTSLENLVQRLGGLKDQRKNILFFSEGWIPQGPRPELIDDLNQPIPRIGVGPDGRLGMGPRNAGRDIRGCDREIARLASIDFRRRFHNLLTDAARANVSFYPVEVGGESRYTSHGPIETLRTMAAATDGYAVLQLYSADLGPGLRRIAEDLQAYYLLGYYSTNAALDGKFREIDVKIPQPGVTLTARRGYHAPAEAMLRAAEAAAERAAAKPAVPAAVTEALATLIRLRPDAALHGAGVRTAAGLAVTLELTSRELMSGRWSQGGAVELTATSESGGEARTITVPVAARARSVVATLPLDAADRGPWRVRARARAGAHLVEQTLEIAPPGDAILGDAHWFRAAAAASAPLRPAAEPLFRRVERLRLEWNAPGPLDSRAARLLDRRGAPLALDVPIEDVERDGGRRVAVEFALAPLAEGDYLIELAAGRAGQTARRLVAFRVTR